MKPILFSTEMVLAILDGRKSMTRRVINLDVSNQFDIDVDGKPIAYIDQATGDSYPPTALARYQPGDILWVRETWQRLDSAIALDLKGDGYAYVYKASENGQTWARETEGWKWKPSIFMPREAARIFLHVTDIRPERLQEISLKDAYAEGCDGRSLGPSSGCDGSLSVKEYDWSIERFETLWDSLNAKRGFGWDVNPYVWVIEFERVDKP